ncbi:MAG: hypothetical protein CMK09_03500 [Ponticaulis sp.]|nr:hypothetical protein [Ponticaulis sp.]|tara:strand:- start:13903 stop:14964 length:1062 start_codon:yes stop_codon:yes gene_type:complete
MNSEAISQQFGQQAEWNRVLGSPLTADILLRLKHDFDQGGATREILGDWPTNPIRDAVGLRLLGALHYAVLSGRDDILAATYPSTESPEADIGEIWPAARAFLKDNVNWVKDFLTRPPQTNETRRGFMFLAGILDLTRRHRLPIHLLELGASAGLNQNFDQFRYTTQNWKWGDPLSGVQVSTDWQALAPPLAVQFDIKSRAACDQNPLDLTDPETRLRLKSYVWVDQTERLERFDAAVELALQNETKVDEADAVDWLKAKLASPRKNALTVICHSVFLQYPPKETRDALVDLIETAGARATDSAPIAWLRFEPEALWGQRGSSRMLLDYRSWPGDERTKLAVSDGHVRLVTSV